MTSTQVARIPGSKSLTNRLLLLAAAADGPSVLRRPLHSDDTVAFADALCGLGVPVERAADRWTVQGIGHGPDGHGQRIWCHDAGTAARFLPPFAAAGTGSFLFDGSDQLRRRPLRQLLETLEEQGGQVERQHASEDLPFVLRTGGLRGGDITLPSRASSQFLSGVLMAAPLMRAPVTIAAPGLVSRPYVDMTATLMERFGAPVVFTGPEQMRVEPGRYRPGEYDVEPDASTASYFLAAAAIAGTTVTVPGLGLDSLQGDRRFADVLASLGVSVTVGPAETTIAGTGRLRGNTTIDMGDISDTFMTLACIAPFADGPIQITGIGHARLKESDRIEAVASNLRACAIECETGPSWITVHPGAPKPALIDCHRDHRIAMSFSVLALRAEGITLDDPDCVSKTFPGFHAEFRRLFGRPA
jgi:3-phosphoshikimate 1-carboxyvinyltransferase